MKRYGLKKAQEVYAGMESEHNPSFRKGLTTAIRKGHVFGLKRKADA